MTKEGGVAKLTITAYESDSYSMLAKVDPNRIALPINPESYAQATEILYTSEEGAGGTGKVFNFNRKKDQTLSLNFVLDGTGAVTDAPRTPVHVQVENLRHLMLDINGKIHTPNFLKIVWGKLIFKCVLKTLDVDFTLFDNDGTPLRADIKASFAEDRTFLEARAAQKTSSPDLTHSLQVEAGETLPLLCDRIYGDSRHYVDVARHNRLDDFRRLTPGTRLLFPPLTGAGA